MRTRWFWLIWATAAVGLVICLELLFIAFNDYFIFPKFRVLMNYGFIERGSLQKAGASWFYTFPEKLNFVLGNYAGALLAIAAVLVGLFEWRVQTENKPLIRFAALGTTALGLLMVVIAMTTSLVVTFCLAMPEHGPLIRSWALEQVASLSAALDGMDQSLAGNNWELLREKAERASAGTEKLLRGPALYSLSIYAPGGWNGTPTRAELQDTAQAMKEILIKVHKNIDEKQTAELGQLLPALRKAYEPIHIASMFTLE